MIKKIINTPVEIKKITSMKMNNGKLSIWLYTNINKKNILGQIYWSATAAYGEYPPMHGEEILSLAKINFDEAFSIVSSWNKKEPSL